MTLPEFYSQMRNGAVTKTSQIGISDYEQAFEKELAAGYDVLYLGFSSGLSGSFNTSCIARDSVMEKYPEGKIICINVKFAALVLYEITYFGFSEEQIQNTIKAFNDEETLYPKAGKYH